MPYDKNPKYDGICRFDPHYEWRKKDSWCGKFNSGKVRRVKEIPEYSDEFKSFWQVYPKKTGQDAAWRAWGKIPAHHYQLAIDKAKEYAGYVADKETNYIKHPSTWINSGCWKDVIEKKVDSKACVDCAKPYQAGHKYSIVNRIKQYRCKECRNRKE